LFLNNISAVANIKTQKMESKIILIKTWYLIKIFSGIKLRIQCSKKGCEYTSPSKHLIFILPQGLLPWRFNSDIKYKCPYESKSVLFFNVGSLRNIKHIKKIVT
jgi:hypothetical protein